MAYGAAGKIRKVLAACVFISCGFAATAEPVVIAAFGDSLTQGYGLAPQNGFVPQLERWLQDQGADVRLINAGVSGDTTAGGAARVEWTLTSDVDGMIVALGGNDLLRGLDPAVSRANLDHILGVAEAADVDVLLVGLPAPGNYGVAYKQAFDAIYPDLAAQYQTLYAPNFFEGFGVGDDPRVAQQFMQSDGIHPNKFGVTVIIDALGPHVLELVEQASD
ncbi:arylesterase [Ruegeria sp.]|uniref:arylesterase n=1 Tax=Ruegeria sp. TaxID=1879320 RepID=UPI00231E7C04|nr:arylesterase [Ruegeria sp.]MDA7967029.1 arylesterase [Ruegeria sp.]